MRAELDLSPVLTGKSMPVTQVYMCGGMSNDSTRHCRRKVHDCHGLLLCPSNSSSRHIVTGDISPACGIFVFHSSCLCTPKCLDLGVKGTGDGDRGRYVVSILDIVCMAASISSSFTRLVAFPHNLYEVLLQDYLYVLLKHRGGHMVIGDSELGRDVVKAFACMARNWRNPVIEPD